MTTRTVKRVVKRKSRRTQKATEFNFTSDMIPQNGAMDAAIRDYRVKAWDDHETLPIPHTKMEPWRRTNLRSLDVENFRLPKEREFQELAPVPDVLLKALDNDNPGGQIVLKPGDVDLDFRSDLAEKGVIFTDLATAEREHPELLAKIMGQCVKSNEGKFAALTTALAQNGVFVYVPKNVHVEQPLYSVSWMPGAGIAHFDYLLVWVEDGGSLTYVHESSSPSENEGQTMHAGVVEILVGDNAHLKFVELQTLGENVWNFTHERAKVGRDSNLDWVFGAIGTHLTKNFSDLDLLGEGSNGRMSGFYFTDGNQHLDHDTQQNHMAPHTTSDLLFKGALKDKSRSVWQGMIYVGPGAQKTDGYQANRNLVLEESARADSIPGLEILADDVRCTHGATVGKIDPEEVFYLRSRGIPFKEAERLVVEGFFDPIMQRIPYEDLRERFQQAIRDKVS